MKQGFYFPLREQVVKHLPAYNCAQISATLVWEKAVSLVLMGILESLAIIKDMDQEYDARKTTLKFYKLSPKSSFHLFLLLSFLPPSIPSLSLLRCFITKQQPLFAHKPTEQTNAGQIPFLSPALSSTSSVPPSHPFFTPSSLPFSFLPFFLLPFLTSHHVPGAVLNSGIQRCICLTSDHITSSSSLLMLQCLCLQTSSHLPG